jgi:CRP-like cAMP-binding protein
MSDHASHHDHGHLLDALPPKVRAEVVKNAKRRTYEPGHVLVREGESALNLFIIDAGSARIEVGGKAVGRFGPGDFFGEVALLEKTNRTATVIAEDGLACYLIPAWEFRALLDEHPEMAIPMLHKLIDRLHGG